MEQMARNAVDPESGHLRNQRYILHDRDTKFCATFRSILESAGTKCLILPPRSPNSNAFSERWVRSAKEECLRKLILFGEGSLQRAMADYNTLLPDHILRRSRGTTLSGRTTGATDSRYL
jgi:transposase InsO family protein